MAQKLEEFDFTASRGGAQKYPWKDWMNGEIYRVTEGEDFEVAARNFRTSLFNAAKRHDLKVRTKQEEGAVVFQFYDA